MRRVEVALLAAVVAVLGAGLVALGTVDPDGDRDRPGTAGPVPTPSASPTPRPLTAGTMRITTFAPGSGELAVSAAVVADGPVTAVLRGREDVVTLTVTPGASSRVTVSGRLRLDCAAVRAGTVPGFDLVLSSGDEQLVVPLPAAQLKAAAVSACRRVAPVPAPTTAPVRK